MPWGSLFHVHANVAVCGCGASGCRTATRAAVTFRGSRPLTGATPLSGHLDRYRGSVDMWVLTKLPVRLDLGGTLHGMRSSFRDWCGETGVAREVAEACLAHRVGSAAEQAYARSDLLERRLELMEAWVRYTTPTGRV